MKANILVPIADGTEELEAVTIIDVLRRAEADVTVASVGKPDITASRGVKLVADVTLDQCANRTYDCIVLPGGMPGAEHLRDSKTLTDLLKAQKQAGRWVAAICASPAVVLAHHGLLPDKATCYPSFGERLGSAFIDSRVVVDGKCITSQGPGTAMAFALDIIRHVIGQSVAKQVADGLLTTL